MMISAPGVCFSISASYRFILNKTITGDVLVALRHGGATHANQTVINVR